MAKYQIGMNEETVAQIESTIRYRFRNRGLLVQAFTRSSFRNEHPEYPA